MRNALTALALLTLAGCSAMSGGVTPLIVQAGAIASGPACAAISTTQTQAVNQQVCTDLSACSQAFCATAAAQPVLPAAPGTPAKVGVTVAK